MKILDCQKLQITMIMKGCRKDFNPQIWPNNQTSDFGRAKNFSAPTCVWIYSMFQFLFCTSKIVFEEWMPYLSDWKDLKFKMLKLLFKCPYNSVICVLLVTLFLISFTFPICLYIPALIIAELIRQWERIIFSTSILEK